MTHTPGPWTYRGWPGNTNTLQGGEDRPYCAPVALAGNAGLSAVACAYGATADEADANARLIAAAPLLLEACKAIASYIDYCDSRRAESTNPMLPDLSRHIVDELHVAILAASGGAV